MTPKNLVPAETLLPDRPHMTLDFTMEVKQQ